MSLKDHDILFFDGACGTNLQAKNLPDSVWDGYEGCTEILSVTAPEVIIGLHREFLDAGSQLIETNTFGAARVVMAEYGLEHRVVELNQVAVGNARQAIGDRTGCYIAGSVGPGTKLPSLGHITVDDLAASAREQVQALVEAGVDCLIVETCQDLLQAKTVIITCFDVLEALGRDLPVMLSVTMERQGTMLVGSDIAAVAATFEPYPLFSLGLNCATGPADMESHIRYLSHNWDKRISCMPNQGLPEVINGKTVYPLKPQEYADHMKRFVTTEGVSIVGGCCGSTPEHIRVMVETVKGCAVAQREVCS